MRVLVTGGGGLLGGAVGRLGALALSRDALDVTDRAASEAVLATRQPEAVVFCAAITDVDRCAHDPRARAVNVDAPAWWARQVPVVLVSTNYVFSDGGPHEPSDPLDPVNAYGRQKAEAEEAVLAAGGAVVRTGWLYGTEGRNFPSTLGAALRAGPVTAIDDWPVQPTWADDLALTLLTLPSGLSHAVGADTGTWAEIATAVAAHQGLIDRVRPTPLAALGLGPRPRDARLAPALLPGWRARMDQLAG